MSNPEGKNTPFVKGNQYWKMRSKHGRDRIFESPEILKEACYEYFDYELNNPTYTLEQKKGNTIIPKNFEGDMSQLDNIIELPDYVPFTFEGLCIFLGVNTCYFNQFEKSLEGKEDERSKEYSIIIKHVKDIIRSNQLKGGMLGKLNPMIVGKICQLKEQVDLTSNGETVVSSVSFVFGVQSENKAIGEGIQRKLEKE